MNLQQISRIIGGTLANTSNGEITGVSTDSRTITQGQLFFALIGNQFDGHDYAIDAIKKGAIACVVNKKIDAPCIVVKDTLQALCDLAQAYRMTLDAHVMAVTGSCGKTTTKDMIAHVLGEKTVKAKGSYNNFIGLPLTILSANHDTKYLVLEIGASKPGEIERLADISYPDIACVTNIAPAHLEGFGSIENVVNEKFSLLKHIKGAGYSIVNKDSSLPAQLPARRIVSVSLLSRTADYHPTHIERSNGKIKFNIKGVNFTLNLHGIWNVTNALICVAACTGMGLRIKDCAERLETFTSTPMRMEEIQIDNMTIYNDAYNSNPTSACNALLEFETLKSSGKKILVFGDMAELGQASEKYHEDIGKIINNLPSVSNVILVGHHVAEIVKILKDKQAFHFENVEEAKETFWNMVKKGDSVLLKGSRTMRLETILQKETVFQKADLVTL